MQQAEQQEQQQQEQQEQQQEQQAQQEEEQNSGTTQIITSPILPGPTPPIIPAAPFDQNDGASITDDSVVVENAALSRSDSSTDAIPPADPSAETKSN